LLAALRRNQFGGDANFASRTPHRTLDQVVASISLGDQARAQVLAFERDVALRLSTR